MCVQDWQRRVISSNFLGSWLGRSSVHLQHCYWTVRRRAELELFPPLVELAFGDHLALMDSWPGFEWHRRRWKEDHRTGTIRDHFMQVALLIERPDCIFSSDKASQELPITWERRRKKKEKRVDLVMWCYDGRRPPPPLINNNRGPSSSYSFQTTSFLSSPSLLTGVKTVPPAWTILRFFLC